MSTNHDWTTERQAEAAKETLALRAFSFAAYSTTAVIITYIPLYFLDQGYTKQQIGWIYSSGPFISIFANLLMGVISDRYQTIKLLLTLILAGQLVMIGLLTQAELFSTVSLLMIGFYFFQTPVTPLSDSLILLSSKHTGRPYALIRIYGSLGFAVSALMIGYVLGEAGSQWTLAVALATIAVTLCLSLLLKDYQGTLRKMDFSGLYKLLRQREVVTFFTLILIISVAHRMYDGFIAVTLRGMGASSSLVGLALLLSAVSEIPILFLLGKYGHKFKELPLLMLASMLYVIRFLLISVLSDPLWVAASQIMHSVTFGIYFSTALRYISQIIPDEYRASGQAVYAIVWSGLAGLISGTMGGAIYEHFGQRAFFGTAAALALLACIGFMLKHLSDRRRLG
ncbi:MFS transporter [Paenibacillus sp. GCM10023252]|uniref:MFS transporter n=1 Tax=Paenibacillus sp. GCM10023252 TaxID=3252649 RepID=UPI003615A1DF